MTISLSGVPGDTAIPSLTDRLGRFWPFARYADSPKSILLEAMARFDLGETLHTFLNEPRAEDPPRRVGLDWVLVGCAMVAVVLETILRNDVPWPAVNVIVIGMMALQLLWRRTHPLRSYVIAFGAVVVLDLFRLAFGYPPSNIYSAAFVLIFMYTVFRWGSGRDGAIATAMAIMVAIFVNAIEFGGWGDIIGGFIVLEFPAVLGLAVRFRGTAREQAVEQAKIHEREMLARELHDTVAHHVSAIAIQAQAGRFLAKSGQPDGAADALEVIEEEASRTLTEMRSIVGVLRSAESTEALAPQHGIADLEALAEHSGRKSADVTVTRSGDLDSIAPAVGAALYRLTQESITNALRHAPSATSVEVTVDGGPDTVELTVANNGAIVSANGSPQGFGIIGMTERATLLGGTLKAGPQPGGGWSVRASLPRQTSS